MASFHEHPGSHVRVPRQPFLNVKFQVGASNLRMPAGRLITQARCGKCFFFMYKQFGRTSRCCNVVVTRSQQWERQGSFTPLLSANTRGVLRSGLSHKKRMTRQAIRSRWAALIAVGTAKSERANSSSNRVRKSLQQQRGQCPNKSLLPSSPGFPIERSTKQNSKHLGRVGARGCPRWITAALPPRTLHYSCASIMISKE
jgi:hypothetical protein